MTTCDDVRTARGLGARLGPEAEAHLAACASCRAEAPFLDAVGAALARYVAPGAVGGLSARVMEAVAPLLAVNARRTRRRALVRAVAAGLAPLPLIVLVDFALVRLLDHFLGTFLPRPLAVYLVADYVALLALLLGLTYAAIPLVAARQLPAPLRRLDVR